MSSQDLIEILANLDFFVQGPNTRSLQDGHYDSYRNRILSEIAKNIGRRLPVGKIEAALWQETRIREVYPDEAFDLLFRHGSSELRLDADSRKAIKKHLQLLRLQGRHDLPKEEQHRWLRSAVPAAEKQRSVAAPKTLNLRYRTRSTSSVPRFSSKGVRKTRKHRSTYNGALLSSIEISETPNSSFLEASPILDTASSNHEYRDINSALPLPSEAEDVKVDIDGVSGYLVDYSATVSTPLPSRLSEIENAGLMDDLVSCNARCEVLNNKCDDLDRQRRQVESLGRVPSDTTMVLRQLTSEISVLKKKLIDRTTLERYLCINDVHEAATSSYRLSTQFRNLRKSLAAVLVVNGSHEPSIGNIKGVSADLDELLSTLFGPSTMSNPETIPGVFPPLNLYELIQALVGAAIHAWVLGSDFHTYVTGQSPLLRAYRHLIATWCGEESLCNLDLAVHRSLFEHENFQSAVIPRIVKALTARLTNALQPLFDIDTKRRATRKLKVSLNSTLRWAVQIRIETLVAAERFELIWRPTGSSFESNEMETLESNSTVSARAVRIPICAGIRAFARGKAMVDYGALAAAESSDASPRYVVKASVLC